jgi:hypothetical protein
MIISNVTNHIKTRRFSFLFVFLVVVVVESFAEKSMFVVAFSAVDDVSGSGRLTF